MAEEMFNEDQRGHMRYLSSLPPEKVCACGWQSAEHCSDACNNFSAAFAKRQREAARYRVWSSAGHIKRIEWAAMDQDKREVVLDAELVSVDSREAKT